MPEKVLSRLLKKLGKGDYVIDSHISKSDIIAILLGKMMEVLRGYRIKYFLGASGGLIFLGRRCKIRYKSHIRMGRTITIGDNVEINALSEEGITIGDNVSILRNTLIECTGVIRNIGVGLVIGNNVGIAQNCFIQVRGKVIIGNNVIIGPGVSVFSENHNFENPDLPVSVQGETRKGVVINDGVWIGTRAVILDGVTVGMNSIIAAGSIVNRDVPPYSIVGGVPAKVIKSRKSMDN
jgi:acetyltransferase-like isoleucine patch superfamily enzyme